MSKWDSIIKTASDTLNQNNVPAFPREFRCLLVEANEIAKEFNLTIEGRYLSRPIHGFTVIIEDAE